MSESILEVTNLTKKYGDLVAVNAVSFSVRKQEIFGILGPNGAGKTSTLEMLETLCDGAPPSETILPLETALADIPALAVTGAEADRMRCGQAVRVPIARSGLVCVLAAGRPVALAHIEAGEARPVRVFNL